MSKEFLKRYLPIVGHQVIAQLEELGSRLQGLRVVHVNSTPYGGGVAEILNCMVPLMRSLGLEVSWEVIQGSPEFFEITKTFHHARPECEKRV